jgi:RNA polymerase sigma-70 factor (ECF subfamily)
MNGPSQSPIVGSSQAALAEPPPVDFRAIYEAEFGYVFHTLRRLGIADRDLEDVIHEVFIAFHRTRDGYDARRPIRPWLFGIAFRVASDWRRRAQHRYEIPDGKSEPAGVAPAADEAVAQAQRRALVLEALESLDLDKRAVFVLHDIDERAMPEVAEALSVPLNTLYSRLRLARAEFAQAVKRIMLRRGER